MNADPCLGTAKTQGVTHGRFQRYRRIRLMDKQKVGPPKGARPIGGHGTPHPPVRQAPSGRNLALAAKVGNESGPEVSPTGPPEQHDADVGQPPAGTAPQK